jgi:hypothetical protein
MSRKRQKFATPSLLGQSGMLAIQSFQGFCNVLIASLWVLIILKVLCGVVSTVWYDICLSVVCGVRRRLTYTWCTLDNILYSKNIITLGI